MAFAVFFGIRCSFYAQHVEKKPLTAVGFFRKLCDVTLSGKRCRFYYCFKLFSAITNQKNFGIKVVHSFFCDGVKNCGTPQTFREETVKN